MLKKRQLKKNVVKLLFWSNNGNTKSRCPVSQLQMFLPKLDSGFFFPFRKYLHCLLPLTTSAWNFSDSHLPGVMLTVCPWFLYDSRTKNYSMLALVETCFPRKFAYCDLWNFCFHCDQVNFIGSIVRSSFKSKKTVTLKKFHDTKIENHSVICI